MQESALLSQHQDRGLSTQHPSRHLSQGEAFKQQRTANTVSMYVGIGKQKIMPKSNPLLTKQIPPRKSENQHSHKSQQKTLIRYKRLDMTAGEASFANINPMKQFKRQTVRSQLKAGITGDRIFKSFGGFLDMVQALQSQFVENCHKQAYGHAVDVIIRLLNYAVDFNLPEQLIRAMKLLADLYFLTDNTSQAFFYYDQTRESCLLLDSPILLVESLMGLAECCGRAGHEDEGIRILKKGLQYAWMNGLEELQLRIYDQIGKLHYHLGNLQKARQYHTRNVNSLYEPVGSALRLLSEQRVSKAQQLNIEMKYKQISLLLLVHLKAPIKTLVQIPLPFQPNQNYDSVRSHFNISSKYFGGQEIGTEIRQLLRGWFFREEIQDLSLPEGDWSGNKHKKFAFLDFQLNQQLRRLQKGNKRERKKMGNRSLFPVKQSLEEQVARKMKEPPLQNDWYEKIVHQINRDHRNKLLNVRDAVRIRGFNKKLIPPLQAIRDLYNTFFQKPKYFLERSIV